MSSTAFVRQVFAWLHQIKGDHELPASVALVAIDLSSRFNEEEHGVAWPSCVTIAGAIGKSEATVINCVRALETRGHLKVEWGQQGRGCSNRYWIIIKPQEAKPQEAKVSKRKKPQKAKVSEAQKTLALDGENLSFHPEKPQPAKETLSIDSSKTHRKKDSPDFAFDEFWKQYPRKVAKGAAWKAYRQVRRKGITTDAELLDGAMRYAAERTGQDAHWTKHPATWLNGECWKDEPAAPSPPQQRGFLDSIARGCNMVPDDDAEVSP